MSEELKNEVMRALVGAVNCLEDIHSDYTASMIERKAVMGTLELLIEDPGDVKASLPRNERRSSRPIAMAKLLAHAEKEVERLQAEKELLKHNEELLKQMRQCAQVLTKILDAMPLRSERSPVSRQRAEVLMKTQRAIERSERLRVMKPEGHA